MKIKQHKEKLEIIRNIIRETLLGNAAIVVLVSMIIVLCSAGMDLYKYVIYRCIMSFICFSSSGLLRLYKFI